jgi:integrase
MASKSIAKRENGKWRARFRDDSGREHARHFDRKVDAQNWLDEITTSVGAGTYVDPKAAKTTVGEWCDRWLEGYAVHRASTVRQAKTHVAHIRAEFGARRLASVRASDVRSWIVKLQNSGLSDSYIYALHARLSQIFTDAIHDDLMAKNPCSRRTSPKAGEQKPYVATTAQVWALHDAMPEHLRAAVLLGAFAGLRTSEVCGLRVSDIDFMRGVVTPTVQYPSDPLKTEASRAPIPIPQSLAAMLSAHVQAHVMSEHMFRNEWLDQLSPRTLERAFRNARAKVITVEVKAKLPAADRLPAAIRFHDGRHYYASLLISSGADVKVVQARLRHKSAKTTLDTYGHMWPDSDDSTRAAINDVITAQVPALADYLRTSGEVS